MAWLGTLVALVGVFSYFALFYWWAATRDFPWLNLLLISGGVGLSFWGFARARRRWLAGVATGLSVLLAGFFVWYCFVFSYDLPGEELARPIGADVPALVLRDQRGADVDLAALARDKLVLVFYRGHW